MMATAWTVQFLDDDVRSALEAWPRDIRARFERIVNLIQTHGLERVREPYVKHLEGPAWEMRMKGKDGICARSLCHCEWPPRGRGAFVRQEDAEDAAPGN
jgi:Phage derived protein Gp49-like (DUF891)